MLIKLPTEKTVSEVAAALQAPTQIASGPPDKIAGRATDPRHNDFFW